MGSLYKLVTGQLESLSERAHSQILGVTIQFQSIDGGIVAVTPNHILRRALIAR